MHLPHIARLFGVWAALTLGLGCAAESTTSLQITAIYEDSWNLDVFEMDAGGRQEQTSAAHALTVLIPENWAGTPLELKLSGLRGGARYAHGATVITPQLRQTVTAQITLTLLSCSDECAVGEAQCRAGGVAACTAINEEGCRAWGPVVPCPETQSCMAGRCEPMRACEETCKEFGYQCVGDPGSCVTVCGDGDVAGLEACDDGDLIDNDGCSQACAIEGTYVCVGSPSVCSRPCTQSSLVVDQDGDVGTFNDLVVGTDGGVHISYYDATEQDLRYAWRSPGGAFAVNVVDSIGDVGQHSAIALDLLNNVHILYHDETQGTLKYAYKKGADAWAVTPIKKSYYSAGRVGLALTDRSIVRFSYYGSYFLGWGGGAPESIADWNTYSVDSSVDMGHHSALAFDAAFNNHISYTDERNLDLRYACRLKSGSTSRLRVDDDGDVGEYNSIALDAADGVHISYYDATSGDLKYAYRAPATESWEISRLDSKGDVGEYTSLAVALDGSVHVAYFDRTNGHLKLAQRTNKEWTLRSVESSGQVRGHISLGLGVDGVVHLSHYEQGGRLKYIALCPSGSE
ncbi:MAG: DUF4215 domain-containing protein [Deltaproteobacteria bacterium]|nr:DUF4215 domain-containing protein [Deltaproteobacteria bacterium]